MENNYIHKQAHQNDCLNNGQEEEEEVLGPGWPRQSRLMMLLVLRRRTINQGSD